MAPLLETVYVVKVLGLLGLAAVAVVFGGGQLYGFGEVWVPHGGGV